MALYALDDLDDALAATRQFLTPVDRRRWLKLALVVLFVGGPGSSIASFSSSGGGGGTPGGPSGPIGPRVWLLIGAVILAVFLLALAVALIGSIMEFVFVESLRQDDVRIRRYWGRRWRQGVRLFAFRFVVGLLLLTSGLLVAAPFLLPMLGFGPVGSGLSIAAFLVLLPLFVVLAVVVGLVHTFTTVFVVPIMILEDVGVLAGWRRLWPTIAPHWKQYLAYAVAVFFLSIVGGILVGVATAVGALVLLLPFGVLFAVGIALLVFVAEPVGIAVLVVVGVLFVLAILAVAALAQVPVKTYLRLYALLVLGDVEPAFDLLPERRAAIRDTASLNGG